MKITKKLLEQLIKEEYTALVEGEGKIVCPNCGHHNEAGVDKCSKCGHPRNKGSWKSIKSEVNKFDQPDAGEAEQRAREFDRKDTHVLRSRRNPKLRATFQKYSDKYDRLRDQMRAVRSKMEQIEAMLRRAGDPTARSTYYREDD